MFFTLKQFRALLPEVRPADSFSGPTWPSANDRGMFDEGEVRLFIAQFRAFVATLPTEERRVVGPSLNGSKAAKRAGTSISVLQAQLPFDGVNSFGVQSWLISSLDDFKSSRTGHSSDG